MVIIQSSNQFKKSFLKLNNKLMKLKILKQIQKIKDNPKIGKPMRNVRKGTREVYISPYHLSYSYFDNHIRILDIYHKDKQ